MGDKFSQLIARLKHEAAAQKKKAALLGGLLLVFVIAVGRLLLPSGGTPASAAAAPPVVPPAAEPEVVAPPSNVPMVKLPTGKTARHRARDPKSLIQHSEAHNVDMTGLPRKLARDPFKSPSWFRRRTSTDEETASPGVSFFDRIAMGWSDYQSRIHATEQLVAEKMADMELQSTLIGPVNSAYISGHLVHEGDEIQGFSVVRIEPRRVILSFSGVQRTLNVR